jgi:YesN/AraC family two-component response regulator
MKNCKDNFIDNIKFLCSLSFVSFKIPVYFIDKSGELLVSHGFAAAANPACPDNEALIKQISVCSLNNAFPTITITKYMETFFTIPVVENAQLKGSLVYGPTIQSEISGKFIDTIIEENNLPVKIKKDFESYYNRCTKKDFHTLTNTIIYIYYSIYQKKLDRDTLIAENSSFNDISAIIEKNTSEALSKHREDNYFHHSHVYEKHLLQCVKDGNIEALSDLRYPIDGRSGELSKGDPVRNSKNITICLTTLVTRAGIEAGLNSELAYTLSDQYIQQLESLNNIKDIEELGSSILTDFTTRIKRMKNSGVSSVVARCQAYIFKNLYGIITLPDLAKHVNLNPNYLSEVFKAQTGSTLRDYIQMQKVDEARKLLIYSKLSILEITNLLNFCNQSHFSRVFKKYAGVSPGGFKNKQDF